MSQRGTPGRGPQRLVRQGGVTCLMETPNYQQMRGVNDKVQDSNRGRKAGQVGRGQVTQAMFWNLDFILEALTLHTRDRL